MEVRSSTNSSFYTKRIYITHVITTSYVSFASSYDVVNIFCWNCFWILFIQVKINGCLHIYQNCWMGFYNGSKNVRLAHAIVIYGTFQNSYIHT